MISSIVKPKLFFGLLIFGMAGPLDRAGDFCDRSNTGTVATAAVMGDVASVWLCMCVFRLVLWLNVRAHMGHLYSGSSEWVALCTANVRDWQKPFPQMEHLNGFSLL